MDGAVVFRAACNLGLEGIVAKRRDRPYRSGRTADWIKVKNPDVPAASRILEWCAVLDAGCSSRPVTALLRCARHGNRIDAMAAEYWCLAQTAQDEVIG